MTVATLVDTARRSTDLAVVLADLGAEFVVVGGTAGRLRGTAHRPRDLDVAVVPSQLPGLVDALASIGAGVDLRRLLRAGPVRVATGWCPLDVFVGERRCPADWIVVGTTRVRVSRV